MTQNRITGITADVTQNDSAVKSIPGKKTKKKSVKNHLPYEKNPDRMKPYRWNLRNWIQLGIFLLTIGIGFQFFLFVRQVSSQGTVTISRPPGVEGFLPIGALMSWKRFFLSGEWDPVHPAAMVILGFAMVISFALRKSFCSWFCPVGTLSEWVWKLGQKWFGKNIIIPRYIDYPLRSVKYILLGFFVWAIFSMSSAAIAEFIHSPYYKMSDVKMLHFFTRMTALTGAVLTALVVFSLFFRNFWCRYLCPYGALMGLFSLVSPTRIRRNGEKCIDCSLCRNVCPYHLPVDTKKTIRSAECTGCVDCTLVCPVKDTLELKTTGIDKHRWNPVRIGMTVILVFVSLVYLARITGHWQSNIPVGEYRVRIQEIDSDRYTHPGGF